MNEIIHYALMANNKNEQKDFIESTKDLDLKTSSFTNCEIPKTINLEEEKIPQVSNL